VTSSRATYAVAVPFRVRIVSPFIDDGLAFVTTEDGFEVRVRWRDGGAVRWRCDVCPHTLHPDCPHARAARAALSEHLNAKD
jgi:hypothetical protein